MSYDYNFNFNKSSCNFVLHEIAIPSKDSGTLPENSIWIGKKVYQLKGKEKTISKLERAMHYCEYNDKHFKNIKQFNDFLDDWFKNVTKKEIIKYFHAPVTAHKSEIDCNFQLTAMANALNINFIDLSPEIENIEELKNRHEDKKKFMLEQMKEIPSNELAKILHQNKYSTIIKAAVKELAASYEKWDSMAPEELTSATLQVKIKNQHSNLRTISTVINSIQDNNGTNCLMQLTLSSKKISEMISPFISGEELLEGNNIELLKNAFIDEISNTSGSFSRYLHKEELSEKRGADPVSKAAISAEAQLFKAEREAKAEALTLSKLSRRGDSANTVIHLKNAFYKEGDGGEKATGTMEKLIWDIAVLMGIDKNTRQEFNSLNEIIDEHKKELLFPSPLSLEDLRPRTPLH